MAVTKVTDAMRDVTQVDAAKITTGTIPDARIQASAVTAHVDLSSVRQDIAMLALYNAVSDNRAAYNLPYSFIDQFEDNSGTTTRTDIDNVSEYFASVYSGSQAKVSTDGITSIGNSTARGGIGAAFDGDTTQSHLASACTNDVAEVTCGKDWGSGVTKTITGIKVWPSDGSGAATIGWSTNYTGAVSMILEGSTDDFSSSIVNLGTVFSAVIADTHTQVDKLSGFTTTTAYRYHRVKMTKDGGGNMEGCISELEFYETPSTVNATGTLISDQQTAPALTKMSGVVLVKDGGSSATVMGDHLKIYFCATGAAASFPSAWVQADSYTAVTAPFSTGVTMYKLGETTVPSGTLPTIRAVWASQTDGGYESQLHGWAMNY